MGTVATVTHTQKLPDGTARTDFRAELRLIASETGDDMGFVTGVPHAVGYRAFAYPDTNGVFTWTGVAPNTGDVTVAVTHPDNTRYGITVRRREGADWVDIAPEVVILVDDTGGTQDTATHLNPLPDDLAPAVSDNTKVAKAGDTMDGDLTAPAFRLPASYSPPNPLATTDEDLESMIARIASILVGTPTDDAVGPGARAVADTRANAVPLVMGQIGDSTVEGYSALATGGYTQVEVVRDTIMQVMGFPAGGIGHRHATTLGYLTPRWTTSAGTPLLDSIGLGQNSCFLPMGAAVTLTTTATHFTLIRQMLNDATVSDLEVIDSFDGTIATLSCYDAAAGSFPGRCDQISAHVLSTQSGARTITVRAKVDGVKVRGATFCNSVFFNGETVGQTVIMLNGGRLGSTTANHLATGLSGQHMNLDALAAANARIVTVQLGLNETDPAVYKAGLISIVSVVEAQYAARSQLAPAWFFVTPWPRNFGAITRTVTQNQVFVDATYQAAAQVGAEVIDAASRLGDTFNDPQDIMADQLHANTIGAQILGQYQAARQIDALAITPRGKPANPPVLATGAGATVDNVISALQSIGLFRQS